jgi:alpha-L-fucosidase
MILNISPKADGTIPQEQKDVLLAMGAWLKKYGEAIYSTRAWEQFGEGPTRMGAAHGVMGAPTQGTAKDIRFTRNKENTVLFAILMGLEKGQKEIKITTLNSDRINCKNLKSVELIKGTAGKYLPLTFKQEADGLTVTIPEISFEDMAYVLKLSFDGKIPSLDKYVDLNCAPHYYLVPGDNIGNLMLGADLTITGKRKELASQWKLEKVGKGFFKIINRGNSKKVLECGAGNNLAISDFTGKDIQIWKFEKSYNGLLKISNKQFSNNVLSVGAGVKEGNKAELVNPEKGSFLSWNLKEVCETKQAAFKANTIPGTIEAEDFDNGCIGDAFYDTDETNEGGQYRTNAGVDMEVCSAGGYNIGWTKTGEWLAYTIKVGKAADYQVEFYVASANDNAKAHLECDGKDITGVILIPNTGAYQKWDVLKKIVKLEAGEHLLKLVIDVDGLNLDKMVFKEVAE